MSEKTIHLKINGKEVEARKGDTVLEVARREGIDIPTLCYHPAVKPYGACRMCVVEVGKEGGPKKVTTSCTTYVEEGMEVETDTDRVHRNRQTVIELLWTRVPKSPELKEMAEEYGVHELKLNTVGDDCILCGLCVRVCEEVVGVGAITFNQRGHDTVIGGPFGEFPPTCIGCGACVYVCPVDAVKLHEYVETNTRQIEKWERKLPMKKCKVCGYPFMPAYQALQFTKWVDLPKDFYDVCPDCRDKI